MGSLPFICCIYKWGSACSIKMGSWLCFCSEREALGRKGLRHEKERKQRERCAGVSCSSPLLFTLPSSLFTVFCLYFLNIILAPFFIYFSPNFERQIGMGEWENKEMFGKAYMGNKQQRPLTLTSPDKFEETNKKNQPSTW